MLVGEACYRIRKTFANRFSVEIVPISKDSVVCLPKKLTHQLGGLNPIALVYKTTNALHLIDVSTGQRK